MGVAIVAGSRPVLLAYEWGPRRFAEQSGKIFPTYSFRTTRFFAAVKTVLQVCCREVAIHPARPDALDELERLCGGLEPVLI